MDKAERIKEIKKIRGQGEDKDSLSMAEKLARIEQTKEHYRKKLSDARREQEEIRSRLEFALRTGELAGNARAFVRAMRSSMPSVFECWLDSDILSAYQNIIDPLVADPGAFDVDAFWRKLLGDALHRDKAFEDA